MIYGLYPYGYGGYNLGIDKAFPYNPINPPTTLPLSLSEVKSFLRVANPLDTSEDALLTMLIQTASDFAQKYTKLTFFTTEFETYRDIFTYAFQLRKYPVQEVLIVERLVDQIFVPVDPLIYFLTKSNLNYPFITPRGNLTWPTQYTPSSCQPQSIKINFVAGFGDAATDIPAGLRVGMLNHIAAMYENRGDCSNCDTSACSGSLPTETRNEYNMWKIISVGPSRN